MGRSFSLDRPSYEFQFDFTFLVRCNESFYMAAGKGERMECEQTIIRLSAGLKEQIQREADRWEISFNALVVILFQNSPEVE